MSNVDVAKVLEDVSSAMRSVQDVGALAEEVLSRAINKALSGARTDAVDAIYKEVNLTKRVIRNGASSRHKGFQLYRASKKNPAGLLKTSGKAVPFVDSDTGQPLFGARQTSKGVTVQVKRNGPRKLIPHAFFARLGKHRGVFWRDYNGPRTVWDQRKKYSRLPKNLRFPISELFGLRLQDILENHIDEVEAKAFQRLDEALRHEIEYRLSQAGGR